MTDKLDIDITRIYKCHNCKAVLRVTQHCSEGFLKECPFCYKDELLIESGKSSMSFIIRGDGNRTIGSIAEENTRRREKETGEAFPGRKKKEKPWWRKSDKVNTEILKNPEKYILTGEV